MNAKAGTIIALAVTLLLAVAAAALYRHREVATPTPAYVGAVVCAACHPKESRQWLHSHHALAMQEATAATVRGDFNNTRYSDGDTTALFYRRDNRFHVRTEGPDGKPADYEIAYTFGVEPLQQYLIRMPGGKLQALGIAWGDQRWFHLYAGQDVQPGEALHWTGREQNWNFMCASCHTTGLEKNYNLEQDTYATRWSETAVACESCHGPASTHVAWAREGGRDADKGLSVAPNRLRGRWQFTDNLPIARRGDAAGAPPETQMCYSCHAHRQPLVDRPSAGQDFLDNYSLTLLEPGVYHPDGQLLEESFEVGSFLQSRMHRAGVTCIDCHEPHGLQLRAQGNALCAQCHQANVYDRPQHHRHKANSSGAQCASCHMPEKIFMTVDARRDHSFRIPRPDLTIKHGVPNACNQCHADMTPRTAEAHIERWHGPDRKVTHVLTSDPAQLSAIARDAQAAPILRATAYQMMAQFDADRVMEDIAAGLRDQDALIRIGAIRSFGESSPTSSAAVLPLLKDPVRAVRVEAARVAARIPAHSLTAEQTGDRGRALEELFAAERTAAERPESHLNLASVHANLGDFARAETELHAALRLAQARNDPLKARATHMLGLLRINEQRPQAALELLAEAFELQPQDPTFAYVYAVALQAAGRRDEAIGILERAHAAAASDEAVLAALATLERERGRESSAARYEDKLSRLRKSRAPLSR